MGSQKESDTTERLHFRGVIMPPTGSVGNWLPVSPWPLLWVFPLLAHWCPEAYRAEVCPGKKDRLTPHSHTWIPDSGR